MHPPSAIPFVDLSLARRLERAEAAANARSVEARARITPDTQACWIEVGGAYAMFDGVDSPLTQTFGLGLFEKITAVELETIEAFFAARGAAVFHEVSPLADPDLLPLLTTRAYRPFEFTSVMFRPLVEPSVNEGRPDEPPARGVRVHVADEAEQDTWTKTAAEGWSEFPEVGAFMQDIGRLSMARTDTTCFLATEDGTPIAAAMMSIHEGVALLAGASTVPAHRGRGAQLALLDARLRLAAQRGCDLAMMCAAPGSPSQRNAERHRFRIAYTRVKWRL